ncbi:MAG: peptidase C39, partial [Aureliella sp.]
MNDIWIATFLMGAVSLLCACLTAFWLFPVGRQGLMGCMAIAIFGMFYFQMYASGQLFWARVLPVSAVIIYSNLSAPLAALAAGWAVHMPNTPVWRRGLMVLLLGGG